MENQYIKGEINMWNEKIVNKVKETLIQAGTTFSPDKIKAYQFAIDNETNPRAKWALETILENAIVAEQNKSPLCDDSGIPHLVIEVGKNRGITGSLLEDIQKGIAEGLRAMPGRPMAIKGADEQRIDQSGGLDEDPAGVLPAPFLIKKIDEDVIRLHIIMQGGGPAIRGKTQRVFHKHSVPVVVDEIVSWSIEAVEKLGCSPCTLAIGIGRSQFEATSMMMEAQIYGRYDKQTKLEKEITSRVNKSNIGPLGLHGHNSVLATFVKVGPQRASGVRVICLRPCCCFEPRIASVEL